MNEFAIEWTRDRDFATVTTPPSTALQISSHGFQK